MSWLVVAYQERLGDQALRQTTTTAKGARGAGRHTAACPVRRLTTGATHHCATAQVVFTVHAGAMSRLQGETKYRLHLVVLLSCPLLELKANMN